MKTKITKRQTIRILKDALKRLPSKELDPRYFATSAESGEFYSSVDIRDAIADGRDIRYCPRGLFMAVVTGSPVKKLDSEICDDDAQGFLKDIEWVAFDVSRQYGKSLPAYRRRVYLAVVAAVKKAA